MKLPQELIDKIYTNLDYNTCKYHNLCSDYTLKIKKLEKYNYNCHELIKNNELELLQFAYDKNKISINNNSMDWALQRGHLEVVKFLHEIGKECTTNAMDYV